MGSLLSLQSKNKKAKKNSMLIGFLALLGAGIYITYRHYKNNDQVIPQECDPQDFGILKHIKTFRKTRPNYEHTADIYEEGTGLTTWEIAKRLGIQYKTSDHPNSKPVKLILDILKINPSGKRYRINNTYNNGGSGKRVFPSFIYPEKAVEIVKKTIDKKAINQGGNLFSQKDVKFRKNQD